MKESLTLEQFLVKELERKNAQLATTNGHIQKLNARKAAASDQGEKTRLEGLIVLHTNYLAEVEAIDVELKAQEKFNKQEENLAKFPVIPS